MRPSSLGLLASVFSVTHAAAFHHPRQSSNTGAPTLTTPGGIYKPETYDQAALDALWAVIEATRPVNVSYWADNPVPEPELPVVLPASPPPLYPPWYAPDAKDVLPGLKFPKGFVYGYATSSYQVEGAVKEDGKGPNNWDFATHAIPGYVADNTTGDVADDQYHLYKHDLARLQALGTTHYSFSVAWSRVFPFGYKDSPINQAGLDYYNRLVDYALELGIEPVITLSHWDIPLTIWQQYGAFRDEAVVADFAHYAETLFKLFNGRVKTWFTFNEPRVFCGQALGILAAANGAKVTDPDYIAVPYQCSYYVLKAHAAAVKRFRELGIEGQIAIKNDDYIGVPWRANSTEDALAAERHTQYQIGVFSDPIYSTGDWPPNLSDVLTPKELPRFTEEEKADILGSADFFATDSYRVNYVRAPEGGIEACINNRSDPLWPSCNVPVFYDPDYGWATGINADPRTNWLTTSGDRLRQFFKELLARWPVDAIYVTEFGWSEPFEAQRTVLSDIREDSSRTNYFLTYLGEILLLIHEDGVPIKGAYSWSAIDNFEWAVGLGARFGTQYVNFTDPKLPREFKRSSIAIADFYRTHLQYGDHY